MSNEQLGNAVLHFLAQHVSHDIVVIGDSVLEAMGDEIAEYDRLAIIDDDCLWARTNEPVYLGGVRFYRCYCEPVADREARRAKETG